MVVFAERKLVLRSTVDASDVLVRIGAPELDESGQNWRCPYEIECGLYRRAWRQHGVDALQALLLSISIIDVELEVLVRKLDGKLYHFDAPFTSILESGGLVKTPPASPGQSS